MDDVVRRRRLLLKMRSRARRSGACLWCAAALGVLAACAGRAPLVGVSGGAHREADAGAAQDEAGIDRGAAIPPDFRESMTKVNHARLVSNGHAAGRFEVDVYANELGKEALAKEHGEVPAGARFVEEHFERAGASAGKTAAIMMLEKRERGFDAARGDWRYVVVGSTGELVKEGVIESCAGCHGDAPHDHLFRVVE
jgi:hypothetical protein